VKLLVGFFGAMFDIDHKAGIMASATALDKIRQMRGFQPSSGNEIITKLCALKDDFSRQTSKTRLAVYELLRSLMTTPEVAKDLQQRHGESAAFMKELLHLCSSERDPDCLLVWFDIQRHFLSEYAASQEILEEVYNIFKAYFPITLPRIAQSSVTPDELKMALRRCFSANQKLAHLTIPFLIGKMDQGAAVTVNVKVSHTSTLCVPALTTTRSTSSRRCSTASRTMTTSKPQ
jgi:DNA repair/transcription protein MET18/MMS19